MARDGVKNSNFLDCPEAKRGSADGVSAATRIGGLLGRASPFPKGCSPRCWRGPLWVKSGHLQRKRTCPLYPQLRPQ